LRTAATGVWINTTNPNNKEYIRMDRDSKITGVTHVTHTRKK